MAGAKLKKPKPKVPALETRVKVLERFATGMVTWADGVRRMLKELSTKPGNQPPKPPNFP